VTALCGISADGMLLSKATEGTRRHEKLIYRVSIEEWMGPGAERDDGTTGWNNRRTPDQSPEMIERDPLAINKCSRGCAMLARGKPLALIRAGGRRK